MKLEEENAVLRQQLAEAIARGNEAIDLAVEQSTEAEKASALLAAVTGVVVAGGKPPAPAPEPKPAPPPAPSLPPPPRPASMSEFLRLSPNEQKRIAEAHGGRDALEATLDEEFHRRLRFGNARGGLARNDARLSGAILADRTAAPATFDAAPYYAGAPRSGVAPRAPTMREYEAARVAQLNAAAGQGPARAAAPAPAPAPKAPAPPGAKTRYLSARK